MLSIEDMRKDLADKIFDQGFHWRILFIGTSVNGTTDIVSSLSRSLRNLGHHVLDLDTSRHRILDNPFRRQGGMGPIYVNYDRLLPSVENFDPQVIICCAGGLTFKEEDAQRLKDSGIVLIGITLSDPDVFPSIQGYQHVFDFHTTNANIALEMYEKAGIKNTLYFPFGIDRGFVTQEVPFTREFDADVICLGHATNRPDRNSVMTHLNEKFDVKTYGRGWEIPDSETVAGQEMVQALQGGKIHINFPLTRAGFINIKCGVFESAGQGRVVATGEFDEMSQFFEYGEEIIGYESENDLEDKIRVLLQDPAEYARVATNGFRRVVTEHLYEHRWMSLFSQIRLIDSDNPRWFSRERAAAISRILSQSLPRAKKVIISGFYGARNLGDEMILRSISQRLRSVDPSVEVWVAAENPIAVESRHGLQSFDRRMHAISAYQVKNASAVVLGGGGLWHDYTFERGGGLAALFTGGKISMAGFGILPMLAKVVGAQFHVVGLGVGPLTEEYAKLTVKFLADQANSIYVRDAESAALLVDIGVDKASILDAPDSVYGVELDDADYRHKSLRELKDDDYVVVGINLRPWANSDMERVVQSVRESILLLATDLQAQNRKVALVAMPMQAGVSMDKEVINSVFRHLPTDIPRLQLDKEGELSVEEYLGALADCDVLLSMRLHAALIAHRVGVPAVGLCYDPKVRRHFDEVDRSSFAHSLDATSEAIKDSLLQSLTDGISATTRGRIRQHEITAVDALNRSAHAISQIPDAARVYSVPKDEEVYQRRRPTIPATPVPASFQKVQVSTQMYGEQSNLPSAATKSELRLLQLALDTQFPKPGMFATQSGVIQYDDQKSYETSLKVTSTYKNSLAEGCIFVEFEVGGQKFRYDISVSSIPVQLQFISTGKDNVPFEFRLVVEKEAFKARSWLAATTVALTLESARVLKPGCLSSLKASNGEVLECN